MKRDRTRQLAARLVAILAIALAGSCASPSNQAGDHARSSVKKGPITEVLEARTPELLRIPGVIGTGEGSEGGERVIVVFVRQTPVEWDPRIPREIDGYKVVVRVAGDVTAPPR